MKRVWLCVGWLLLAGGLPARDSVISNLVVSGSASPGGTVTVSFDIAAGAGGSGDQTRFAVGFANAGYTYNCNTTNQINWVALETGIYSSSSYTVDGTPVAVTPLNFTSVVGPNGGLVGGTGTTARHVVMTLKVPPEFSGNYRVVVLGNRDGMGLQSTSCGSCVYGATSVAYGDFTVTGANLIKLNLEVCNAGECTTGAICWQYRVTNWGESGVRLTGLAMKFCYYDTNFNWQAQSSSNAQAYLPGGASYCNTYNPADQYSFESFNTVDCGPDGKANQCYRYTIAGGPISQSMPYFVPPNGGYLQSQSPPIWLRPVPNVLPTVTDDYTNLTLAPACGSGWSSLPRVALYNNGQLVCEWESGASEDVNTGVPHCGATSGCNKCPDGMVSNLARNASGPSNVVCLPIYSPTPTPGMQLTKTADQATKILGDTITYTITWANNSSSSQTIRIWDTIPSNVTYVGCDNACSVVGGLVSWNLGPQGPGSSGVVRFWARVTSLPFLPWKRPVQQALLEPEFRRSRDLLSRSPQLK
jgi:uncharacterized repeat protein (TIGR01451 family)